LSISENNNYTWNFWWIFVKSNFASKFVKFFGNFCEYKRLIFYRFHFWDIWYSDNPKTHETKTTDGEIVSHSLTFQNYFSDGLPNAVNKIKIREDWEVCKEDNNYIKRGGGHTSHLSRYLEGWKNAGKKIGSRSRPLLRTCNGNIFFVTGRQFWIRVFRKKKLFENGDFEILT